MAARAGRQRRTGGVSKKATPTTVRLTQLHVAETAASALGVSRDAYLDAVLAREAESLDANGRPHWWPGRDQYQEELPLRSA